MKRDYVKNFEFAQSIVKESRERAEASFKSLVPTETQIEMAIETLDKHKDLLTQEQQIKLHQIIHRDDIQWGGINDH